MITLATTTQQTVAKPQAIFALWQDIDHWADFDDGIEWAKLTDTATAGGHYVIKPKGGPKVKATIMTAEPNSRFVDLSQLFCAKLNFDHRLTKKNNITTVTITQTLDGIFTPIWAKILGKDQQADLEKSTAKLIAKAETQ